MRRYQLFEWGDQPWLPVVFRDFITDHLLYFLSQKIRKPVNRSVANHLKPLLVDGGCETIVDLCAGAGGPSLNVHSLLLKDLRQPLSLVLTDLYPNHSAFQRHEANGDGLVHARYDPISAFDVPSDLQGIRTLFTSLHHFKPTDARRVLDDAARKGQPIAIFEPLERTHWMLLYITLYALWHAFVLTPCVGRLTIQRFLWTYVIPVAPGILLWDGIVSVLRTYTPDELSRLAESVGGRDYEWSAGRFEAPGPIGIPMPTTYLIGTPHPAPVIDDHRSGPCEAVSLDSKQTL